MLTEVVLEGVIQSLWYRPIAFSNSDEAAQYETIMELSALLRDPRRDLRADRARGRGSGQRA